MTGTGKIGWAVGAIGAAGVVAYRFLRRERGQAVEPPPDPRADELRRRLDESRSLVAEREEFEQAETHVDEAEPAPPLDSRRRGVHDRARTAADEMRRPPSG